MKNRCLLVLLLLPLLGYGQYKQVDRVLDSCVNTRNFNGAVLIAKKGQVQYLRYSGIANRHYNIPFSDKTRFPIFSVTKTFTAALILQLYEQGRLDLDATIGTYYPAYKGPARDKASIRNLLTYSSGRDALEMQPAYIPDAYDQNLWPTDTFISRYCSGPLLYPPGTRFNYSNGDYIILGRIIELICHKPFEQVLQEQILGPLKMHHTGYLHYDDIIPDLDEGYYHSDSSLFDLKMPTNHYMDNHFSAGAMYSDPIDLLLFDQAIFNSKLLKKTTTELMLKPEKALEDAAFGMWVYPRKIGNTNTIFAERQGGGYGHHANWVHLIDREITLIILSNTETTDLNTMRLDILAAYLDHK